MNPTRKPVPRQKWRTFHLMPIFVICIFHTPTSFHKLLRHLLCLSTLTPSENAILSRMLASWLEQAHAVEATISDIFAEHDGDCYRTETIFTIMSIIAHVLARLKQLQIDRNLILNTATGPWSVQQLDGCAVSSLVPTYHSTWRLTARVCHYLQNYHICSFPYMPWLQEVISLSLLWPRFDLRPMHVRYVLNVVIMWQVFLLVLQFSTCSIIQPMFSSPTRYNLHNGQHCEIIHFPYIYFQCSIYCLAYSL